ncbi:MAG: dTMP kinase [Acidobacteria bacterium]|nr:dTMP kinase [Acidobacteriota bacterium]
MIPPVTAKPHRGVFITIEGLDGCGKSTQLGKLAAALRREGHNIVVTREPGGTPLGEQIRAVSLDSRTAGLSPRAETAMMFAARAQHVDQVILPALEAGAFVLCDRFTDSTEAYQGGGRQLGSAPVRALHKLLCHGLDPDLTILMDSDVEASVARARRRNRSREWKPARASTHGRRDKAANESRFEHESREFFERVRDAYLAIARREPGRVLVVNARKPIPQVEREIWNAVRERALRP